MDDYWNYHIPAFGSWDVSNDLPITQYFESARHAGLGRYSKSGDLYRVHEVQCRVGPRTVAKLKTRGGSKKGYSVREAKKQCKVCDMNSAQAKKGRPPRAVDEDLYKIPPELLHRKSSSKGKMMGMLSSCLGGPGCVA